jgi:hypothetical protein
MYSKNGPMGHHSSCQSAVDTYGGLDLAHSNAVSPTPKPGAVDEHAHPPAVRPSPSVTTASGALTGSGGGNATAKAVRR